MTSSTSRVDVVVRFDAEDLRAALRRDAAVGLTSSPKEIPPKWFYDARGSELFDAITHLPEYYPTRCERSILGQRADEIAALTGADTVVEIGSGTSEKTRVLLDALARAGQLRGIVTFDMSEPTLRQASIALAAAYPDVAVRAVVGDFERHLSATAMDGRRLVAFLGGTIGNLRPKQRAMFVSDVATLLRPGEALLLGTDLVKDVARLEAAYDDDGGVTGEFNRNVLHVINRELGANFVPARFSHEARFDRDEEWIEMLLRCDDAEVVSIADLDMAVPFYRGEAMRTEISAKFRRSGIEAELNDAGFTLARWWTDAENDFAVSLSFKE